MKQSTFVAALKFASHAMAIKDIRYYLNGVLFEFRGATLTLVGTDGHRMAYVELSAEYGERVDGDFTVSNDCVKLLLTAFKAASTGTVEFEFDSDKLLIRGASGQTIQCSFVAGKYPDWKRVCKSGAKPVATEEIGLNGVYLADAAKACAALGTGKHAGVKITLHGPHDSILAQPAGGLPAGILEAACVVMSLRV